MTLHHFLQQLAAAGLYTPANHTTHTNGHPPGPPPAPGDPQASRYAHAALVAESHRMAGQPEGVRNHELNRSAYRMGQLIAAGYLDRTGVYNALLDAAHTSGLPTSEARATILSGLNAGMNNPRAVALRPALGEAYTLVTPDPDNPGQVGTAAEPAPGDGLPRTLDWHSAYSGTAEDIDWLITDVLEQGANHVIYAPHKIGKSLLSQYWSAQLATSGRRVLYIDLENSVSDIVERMRHMGHQPGDLQQLHYLSFPSMAALDTVAGGATLVALAEKHQVELVVLDTTSRVVAGKENDSDTYRALYRYALVPLKAMGVTVLRLDHAGKDLTAGQRGSSAKGDDVDCVWLLVRHDEERYTLKCDAQRSGHYPLTVDLLKRDSPLRFERVIDPFSQPKVTAAIDQLDRLGVPEHAGRDTARAALAKAGIKVGTTTLTEAIKIRKTSISSSKYLSGTGQRDVDHAKINIDCPEDQLTLDVSPGQTCPGQVQDSGDSSSGVPKAAPVPDPVRPKGGQVGQDSQDRSRAAAASTAAKDQLHEPAQDPLRCHRCHQLVGRTIPGVRGQRWCVECAYPDPTTRPGATLEEN